MTTGNCFVLRHLKELLVQDRHIFGRRFVFAVRHFDADSGGWEEEHVCHRMRCHPLRTFDISSEDDDEPKSGKHDGAPRWRGANPKIGKVLPVLEYMMDRTVILSQLWGECRYCPKFPEKNVQNSKKCTKIKKKCTKIKKNVQN